MTDETKPLSPKGNLHAFFDDKSAATPLSDLCQDLLLAQKKDWADCRKGYESLRTIKRRELECAGFSVVLQNNPGRMKSTVALVGDRDIEERPCFLCVNNLPEGQKGILYRKEFMILCNPMPVFSSHFTIASVWHEPQVIKGAIPTFLRLAADLGDRWVILYNGPKCGASAPDHLHFQSFHAGHLPIEREMAELERHVAVGCVGSAAFYEVKGVGRTVVVLDGDDPIDLGEGLDSFMEALALAGQANGEPMINIVAFHRNGRWRLAIFPRRAHRPAAFFREGDDRVVVSPAVVEMGGIIVTPLDRDFIRLSSTDVEGIYREVSLEREIIQRVIETISQ
jgi:hypothetical protein